MKKKCCLVFGQENRIYSVSIRLAYKYTNSNNTLFSATNCSILSCGENEECLQVNDIFQCVCKDDYEGPNCELGKAINMNFC